MDLQDVGYDGIDGIKLAQDKDRWRALVNEVTDSKNAVNFLTS